MYKRQLENIDNNDIPAWSLVRLLELLPYEIPCDRPNVLHHPELIKDVYKRQGFSNGVFYGYGKYNSGMVRAVAAFQPSPSLLDVYNRQGLHPSVSTPGTI